MIRLPSLTPGRERIVWFSILAVCLFFVWDMYKDFFHDPEATEIVTDEPLSKDELARIALKPGSYAIRTDKGVKAGYVPPSGHVNVSLNRDGTVHSTIKNKGTSLELGLGGVYADRLRITADVQLAYWNRFSFHGGVALADNPVIVPFIAVGYRLDGIRLQNTSLILGVTARKDFVVGLRVEI